LVACNLATWEAKLSRIKANSLKDPILKIINRRRGWWSGASGKVVKHLPSKCEALSSSSNTTKKNLFLDLKIKKSG
jgi:hypothetical protein